MFVCYWLLRSWCLVFIDCCCSLSLIVELSDTKMFTCILLNLVCLWHVGGYAGLFGV